MIRRKTKHLCLAAAALTLTMGVSVGSAMAYFTTYASASGGASLSLSNTVTISGGAGDRLDQACDDPEYWRCGLLCPCPGIRREKKYQDGLTYADDEGKWTPGEDGCYYYSDVVPAGGETQELRIGIDHMDSDGKLQRHSSSRRARRCFTMNRAIRTRTGTV